MRSLDIINAFFKDLNILGFKGIKIQKPNVEKDFNHDQFKIMKSYIGVDLYKEKVYKIIIDDKINVFVVINKGRIESPVKGFHQSYYYNNAEYADTILWKLRQNQVIPHDYKLSKVFQFDGGTGDYYRWGQTLKNITAGEINILETLSSREEDNNPRTLEEIYNLLEKGYKLETHYSYGYIFKDLGLIETETSRVNGLINPELKILKSLKS